MALLELCSFDGPSPKGLYQGWIFASIEVNNKPLFTSPCWSNITCMIASTTCSFSLVLSSFLIDHSYSQWTTNFLVDLFSYSTSLHSFLFSKRTLLAKRYLHHSVHMSYSNMTSLSRKMILMCLFCFAFWNLQILFFTLVLRRELIPSSWPIPSSHSSFVKVIIFEFGFRCPWPSVMDDGG